MHKKENFYIKLLTNVGNPDFKQDPTQRVWGTSEIKNVGYKKLSLLRELVTTTEIAKYLSSPSLNKLISINLLFSSVIVVQRSFGYSYLSSRCVIVSPLVDCNHTTQNFLDSPPLLLDVL